MSAAVECTFKAIGLSTYRRPFISTEVDIGGQLEKFTLIGRAAVHILCKASELFAVCYFERICFRTVAVAKSCSNRSVPRCACRYVKRAEMQQRRHKYSKCRKKQRYWFG